MAEGLYRQVHSPKGLREAWLTVRANGVSSRSSETREAIRRFDDRAEVHLRRLADQLRERRFHFQAGRGVPIPRKGKAPRPLVVAPVENRIVQRRLLDILQRQEALLPYLLAPTSFGGVPGRDVRKALNATARAIKNGGHYFLRSDIVEFFRNIPRGTVLELLDRHLPDPEFQTMLHAAVDVELSNLHELGSLADLFPLHEVGVAQGCCLSVLIGNVLLRGFDERLNGRGVICLRYIDDFLLVGPNRASVLKAFDSAQRLLGGHGLTAYDPRDGSAKAACGLVDTGFEFLGCEVRPGFVRPSRAAQTRLLSSMDYLLTLSLARLKEARWQGFDRRYSYLSTLYYLSNMVRAWGNQYSFCNDSELMENLHRRVLARWWNYERRYRLSQAGFDEKASLRALGFHLLPESKREPIRWDEVDEQAARETGVDYDELQADEVSAG